MECSEVRPSSKISLQSERLALTMVLDDGFLVYISVKVAAFATYQIEKKKKSSVAGVLKLSLCLYLNYEFDNQRHVDSSGVIFFDGENYQLFLLVSECFIFCNLMCSARFRYHPFASVIG